jgi:hypothetical protein
MGEKTVVHNVPKKQQQLIVIKQVEMRKKESFHLFYD